MYGTSDYISELDQEKEEIEKNFKEICNLLGYDLIDALISKMQNQVITDDKLRTVKLMGFVQKYIESSKND